MITDNKTWLEVEMEESVELLRKRLETINAYDSELVDDDTVRELEKIYKCLLHIKCLKDNKQ